MVDDSVIICSAGMGGGGERRDAHLYGCLGRSRNTRAPGGARLSGGADERRGGGSLARATDLARVRALGGRPRDDYEGLSWSFAAACRAADANHLVRAGNIKRLQLWLAKRSADERTAIQKHLGRQACR